MKRIEKVKNYLAQIGVDSKVSASQVAEKLGYSRANVSNDLNRLCEEGIAQKSGSKPIYYSIVEGYSGESHFFDEFLKENNSLYQCVELAKAAVLYPPFGMHMLLLGETGVGKSMFAKMIYQYALLQNIISSDHQLITFNCADYANNPQLLLGQIFGVVKGAYTGADSDRPGLLEQADESILFLDEIHRLPPEGQEMLFTYIDTGSYRRLGETNKNHSAKVLLICATTEDPASALLTTFLRRIPMQINIPNLSERTLDERLRLINQFINDESAKLNSSIFLSVNSLRALLGYTCKGNVGQLKSDIQLLCAKAYSEYISGNADTISISSYSLMPHIRSGLYSGKDRKSIWSMLSNTNARFIEYSVDKSDVSTFENEHSDDIYQKIEKEIDELRQLGLEQEQIDESLNDLVKDYYKYYLDNSHSPIKSEIEHYVGSDITTVTSEILELSSRLLNRSYSDNIKYGLALHLYNAVKRVRQGLPIKNPMLQMITKEMLREYSVADQAIKLIEQELDIKFPKDEVGFIALFLVPAENMKVKRNKVQVIVAAHGTGVATGMAEIANRLLGQAAVKGFDVPLDASQDEIYAPIKEYIKSNGFQEVVFLVDMGSLVNLAFELERDLKIQTKCFVMVSTMHVIEAGRKALMGYSLHDVYKDIKQITNMTLTESKSIGDTSSKNNLYLLSVCTTGDGGAQFVKKHLTGKLDLKEYCEIVNIQYADRQLFDEKVEKLTITGRIIGVVSSFSTSIPVPHFTLYQMMENICLRQIQELIDTETIIMQVSKTLFDSIEAFDDFQVINDIRDTVERIERAINNKLSNEMLIGVLCHIGCVMDRLKRGEKMDEDVDTNGLLKKYPKEINLIQQECNRLAVKHDIAMPLTEACYVAAFFMRELLI